MGQVINTGPQSMGGFNFNQAYTGGGTGSGGSGGSGATGAAIASSIASGISSIVSTIYDAKKIKDIMQFNSGMTALQKRMVRLSTQNHIRNIRKEAQSMFSAQRAAVANSGMALTGSPAAVMLNTAKEYELDEIFSNINADLAISVIDTQNEIARMEKKAAIKNEYMGIGKTVLNMFQDNVMRA